MRKGEQRRAPLSAPTNSTPRALAFTAAFRSAYHLARDCHTSSVIAPPTWEEAPVTFRSWLDQRTRWIKGHMQTWLVLMRNPIRTAREMGLPSFAAMHLMLTGGLIAALVHGPWR